MTIKKRFDNVADNDPAEDDAHDRVKQSLNQIRNQDYSTVNADRA